MLDYVGTKATPGQTFEITSLLFWGDQAAGIAVCTNRNVDSLLVIMKKKGSSGWYGVEQGTDVTLGLTGTGLTCSDARGGGGLCSVHRAAWN